MIPEIDVSSVLATVALVLFYFVAYLHRRNLFGRHSIESFMRMSTAFFALLFALFLYVFFCSYFEISPLKSVVPACIIASAAACFLEVWEFGKNEESIALFLGETLVAGKRWPIGVLWGIYGALFIGIFAFQSSWTRGAYLFFGIGVLNGGFYLVPRVFDKVVHKVLSTFSSEE